MSLAKYEIILYNLKVLKKINVYKLKLYFIYV